jgi:hypothetical protein
MLRDTQTTYPAKFGFIWGDYYGRQYWSVIWEISDEIVFIASQSGLDVRPRPSRMRAGAEETPPVREVSVKALVDTPKRT